MTTTNAIIDLSHFNQNVDFVAAQASGIVGVIHKASQGLTFRDPVYTAHRASATSAGLRWGAYHFGTGADAVAQADNFLNIAKPDTRTLLVLDFETNPQGSSMTLEGAREFATYLRATTGRWPGIYSGWRLKSLLGTNHDPILAKCWLWLAQYGPVAVFPQNWVTWTLWQYTDGAQGPAPHSVPGVGACDRNLYHGDDAALAAFLTPASHFGDLGTSCREELSP